MNLFCVNSVTAGYGTGNVIENLTLCVEKGSMVGILGANGSGKTTLLKSVCGILPHSGTCSLEGTVLEHLSARQIARLVSYIPQRSGICIDISALDVVLMGFNPHLGLLEQPNQAMIEAARTALNRVGLGGKEQTNYLHLSEGQKQLCILARTLITQSELLLLDEPESALDFHHRYHMFHLLRQWNHEHRTMALVTLHDPNLALNYCDRLLLLSNGQIIDMIQPPKDSLTSMETKLQQLYQNISLHECINKNGHKQIVMLGDVI